MSDWDFSATFVSTGPWKQEEPKDERSALEKEITDVIELSLSDLPVRRDALLHRVIKIIHEDEFERNWRDNL